MNAELSEACENILIEYSPDALALMQQEMLKYVKEPVTRIYTDMCGKTCCKCKKKPIYYETSNANLLCWYHANELSRMHH